MMIRLLPLLLLAGCAHSPAATCANAERARTVALLAIQAIDRVCPAPAR